MYMAGADLYVRSVSDSFTISLPVLGNVTVSYRAGLDVSRVVTVSIDLYLSPEQAEKLLVTYLRRVGKDALCEIVEMYVNMVKKLSDKVRELLQSTFTPSIISSIAQVETQDTAVLSIRLDGAHRVSRIYLTLDVDCEVFELLQKVREVSRRLCEEFVNGTVLKVSSSTGLDRRIMLAETELDSIVPAVVRVGLRAYTGISLMWLRATLHRELVREVAKCLPQELAVHVIDFVHTRDSPVVKIGNCTLLLEVASMDVRSCIATARRRIEEKCRLVEKNFVAKVLNRDVMQRVVKRILQELADTLFTTCSS